MIPSTPTASSRYDVTLWWISFSSHKPKLNFTFTDAFWGFPLFDLREDSIPVEPNADLLQRLPSRDGTNNRYSNIEQYKRLWYWARRVSRMFNSSVLALCLFFYLVHKFLWNWKLFIMQAINTHILPLKGFFFPRLQAHML